MKNYNKLRNTIIKLLWNVCYSIPQILFIYLIVACVLVFSFFISKAAIETLSGVLGTYTPELFDNIKSFFALTRYNYTILSALALSISILVLYLITLLRRTKKRDKKYIYDLLNSVGSKMPIASREDLLTRISGGSINEESLRGVNDSINENIEPIKFFLDSNDNICDILSINAKWGTGKTTSLLIAINESENDKNQYIYESAFKYQHELSDFFGDLLGELTKIAQRMGVDLKNEFRSLVKNIDSKNISQIISNLFDAQSSFDIPTSTAIQTINTKYRRLGKTYHIVIIIDDIDRLPGEDILEIISLLSILRRLEFVKIIIPADISVIVKSLSNAKVIDPDLFIEKYIPGQATVEIKSDYKIVENVALKRMKIKKEKISRERNYDRDSFKPAFAAILIGLIAIKFKKVMKEEWLNIPFPWPSSFPQIPDEIKGLARTILKARDTAVKYSKALQNVNGSSPKYNWQSELLEEANFERMIYDMVSNDTGHRVANSFSETDYNEIVGTWIFKFCEENWKNLGFNFRSIQGYIDSINYDKLPMQPNLQFAEIFNKYFPNARLNPVS